MHHVDAVSLCGHAFSFHYSFWHFPGYCAFHPNWSSSGVLDFSIFWAVSSFGTFPGTACLSLFALLDAMSIICEMSVSSNSMAMSENCLLVIFFVWVLLSSPPSELVASQITRHLFFCSARLIILICSAEELATSLFEYTLGFAEFSGRAVIMWADSLSTLAALLSNKLSSFDPHAR